MAWGAIIGAVSGFASGIFGGISQQQQADAYNAQAKENAQAQYQRALQEWELGNAQQYAQWQWDRARIEQLRFNQRQEKADYLAYNAKLINAAQQNLRINQGALYDKFVTEEALRGTQVGLEYSYSTNKLGAESTETLRQYLQGINQNALQSSAVVSKLTGESQELLASLALDEQRDQLGWQINQLAAMAKDAEAKGAAVVRQGGGKTAQRLASEAGKQLGRAYGELVVKSQDRGLRMSLMNRTMNDDVAKQLGQVALQTQDAVERMKYSNQRYQADYNTAKEQMDKLTIPSFGLADRQYGRELESLRLQTQQVVDQASQPFREQVYFDPLEPIKGLKPEMISPTLAAGPSWGGVIGNSILGGIQGAMQFSTNKNGKLSFY